MRYRAFFSYARADDRIANWLHRQLDGYRTPKALIGLEGELGPVPAKLHPIFRDRTDLESGGHVDAALQEALEDSSTLIVLCTPTSARSHWVNHEVETFLKLGREAVIFPVIAAGVPDSADRDTECFPPALRGKGLLAADLREIKLSTGQLVGDGREGARLKLIAGLLGIALDKLVQRERRRQRQTVAVLGAAALTFLGVAIAAGAFWWVSDQRAATITLQTVEISMQRDSALEAKARAERSADEARRARDSEAAQKEIAERNAKDAQAKQRLAVAARELAVQAQESEKRRRQQTSDLLESIVLQLSPTWAPDTQSPDYRHLRHENAPDAGARSDFRVDLATLKRALDLNGFQPKPMNGHIIFALRGAGIVDYDREKSLWISLRDVRPDHRSLSCVFMALDTRAGSLTAFPGTTVPSDPYLRTQFAEQLEESRRAHLLPTGMYEVRVGTSHQYSRGGRPGVFTIHQVVAVRRTTTDLTFDVKDPWYYGSVASSVEATSVSRAIPMQRALESVMGRRLEVSVPNIEGEVAYSSAGLLQIQGRLLRDEEARYAGPFAQFRHTLGLSNAFAQNSSGVFVSADDGVIADVVLLTGLDVALAGELQGVEDEQVLRTHRRLRWGSSGAEVKALQGLLGVSQSGVFDVHTSKALAELQTQRLGWSDGIYSVGAATSLGLSWK